jgi:hypothetical protein
MQKVQSLMKDQFLFLRYDQKELDALVLMNGCPRACTEDNFNRSGIPYRSILRENDFEPLINWLKTLDRSLEE